MSKKMACLVAKFGHASGLGKGAFSSDGFGVFGSGSKTIDLGHSARYPQNIIVTSLCMDGQTVAVCFGNNVHCWRDLFASQFERRHCFVIYSWMRNGVSQFQPPTPMAIYGQRTHFFTGIATKTWCGHHFQRVSTETECQNSSLGVSLFGIWEKSHDQNSQIPKNPWIFHTSPTGGATDCQLVLPKHQWPCRIGTDWWWWALGSLGATRHNNGLHSKIISQYLGRWKTTPQPHRYMSPGSVDLSRQSAARSFLSNRLWHSKLSECLGPPVEPKPGLLREDVEFVFTKTPFSLPCFVWYDQNHFGLNFCIRTFEDLCFTFATQQSGRKFGDYCDVTFEGWAPVPLRPFPVGLHGHRMFFHLNVAVGHCQVAEWPNLGFEGLFLTTTWGQKT